eukprot:2765332-Rhodomonas_salina.1
MSDRRLAWVSCATEGKREGERRGGGSGGGKDIGVLPLNWALLPSSLPAPLHSTFDSQQVSQKQQLPHLLSPQVA